jgi:chromate transporter
LSTVSAAAAAAGGLLSGALFQYPGAIIMTAVGVFAAGNLVDPKGALAGVASGGAQQGQHSLFLPAFCLESSLNSTDMNVLANKIRGICKLCCDLPAAASLAGVARTGYNMRPHS